MAKQARENKFQDAATFAAIPEDQPMPADPKGTGRMMTKSQLTTLDLKFELKGTIILLSFLMWNILLGFSVRLNVKGTAGY